MRSPTEQMPAADFPELPMTNRLLLGPGPDMVHPRVMAAMTAPLLGHLDPAFLQVMDRTSELLRYAFQTDNRLTIPDLRHGLGGDGGRRRVDGRARRPGARLHQRLLREPDRRDGAPPRR